MTSTALGLRAGVFRTTQLSRPTGEPCLPAVRAGKACPAASDTPASGCSMRQEVLLSRNPPTWKGGAQSLPSVPPRLSSVPPGHTVQPREDADSLSIDAQTEQQRLRGPFSSDRRTDGRISGRDALPGRGPHRQRHSGRLCFSTTPAANRSAHR